VRGSFHNDTIIGSATDNLLRGMAGNDHLDGGAGFDVADYWDAVSGVTVNLTLASNQATGGDGTDQLFNIEGVLGSWNADVLTGNAGDNFLMGRGGNDTLNGGAGYDTASYRDARGAVNVNLALATNQAFGSDGIDHLVSIEALEGSAFNDTLGGGLAGDRFRGRGGNDSINGGAGVDVVEYRDAVAAVNVDLGRASNHATGGDGVDQLVAIEDIRGSAFGDTLRGAAGRNVIDGRAGNDTIGGGAGADNLIGGIGNDIFDFNAASESGITAATWDTIVDFVRGTDRIDLSNIDANSANGAGTNEAFTAIIAGTAAFTTAGQLKISSGVLYGNTDTDAGAEFAIALTGITAVASADFIM
jgi:Ca2+-binding RTX toxin-like protein